GFAAGAAGLLAAKDLFDLTTTPVGSVSGPVFLHLVLRDAKDSQRGTTVATAVAALEVKSLEGLALTIRNFEHVDLLPVTSALSEYARAGRNKNWTNNKRRVEGSIASTAKFPPS